jgi:hypothetical protein
MYIWQLSNTDLALFNVMMPGNFYTIADAYAYLFWLLQFYFQIFRWQRLNHGVKDYSKS